ncbi:MAG: DUF2325 domain-containing protein [Methanosarcinales archaeon]|nr:DUF2325 domain-containing protein [Methanosarcinales archaeon]
MSERKIWEFKNQTVCTILGLTFDEKELSEIYKKLKLNNEKITPFGMHTSLIQACSTQNRTSKQLDKILTDRFEEYREDIKHIPQKEIYRYIEDGNGMDIPLPALVWFAMHSQHEDIDKIEARVYAVTHMYGHRALRFHAALNKALPDGRPEYVMKELNDALRSNEKLQTKCNRLEWKKEQLKSDMESVKEDRSKINTVMEEQKQLNRRLASNLEKVGGENALGQIEDLKKEIDLLTEEVGTLTNELLERDRTCDITSNELSQIDPVSESGTENIEKSIVLDGMRVAYVGGVESLTPHYKEVIESFGGTFCYHCGRCIHGKKEIENLVDGTDIIFCPMDINSRAVYRYIKKACKIRNKPCHFLRSSGLSMLIRELEDHAEKYNYTS